MINRCADGKKHAAHYDQQECERGVKAVMKGKFLASMAHETVEMFIDQQTLLYSIPLDAMRNNSNKLVNQDMDVAPLEEMNQTVEGILHEVARNIHNSSLMKRYVSELTKADREKWQLSEVDKAMVKGGDKAYEYIQAKAEAHLIGLTSRMEWFPVAYHLADKVALVVFPILGYSTGKYHLTDTMVFLWLIAAMPILGMRSSGASMNWRRGWNAERRSPSHANEPSDSNFSAKMRGAG